MSQLQREQPGRAALERIMTCSGPSCSFGASSDQPPCTGAGGPSWASRVPTAYGPGPLRLDVRPLHDERQLDVHMVLGDLAILDDGRTLQHVQAGDVPEGL